MANTGNKMTPTRGATATSTSPAQAQTLPHPVAALGSRSRRLKFAGCCLMSDKQLEQHYKLYRLSDEELASVGLKRSAVIDDYRVLHEVSQLRQLELKREKALHNSTLKERALKLKYHLGIRPHKTYKFQLLNQLIKVIDLEFDPSVVFPDPAQFLYLETEAVRKLGPRQRESRKYEAFYDHLDDMFVNGDRNKAIDMVVEAFVRLKKRRMQISRVPIPQGYMSPRGFDLIPRRPI